MNLLNLNIDTSKVVLAGDSAGSNLKNLFQSKMNGAQIIRPKTILFLRQYFLGWLSIKKFISKYL
jgi:hypothetical protein